MPITKTAKRSLRNSEKKRRENALIISKLETLIRSAKKGKSAAKIAKAVSSVDKAVKKHVIHKNKAARIKSSLAR